jgi:aspartate/glutamate racemase
MKRLGLVGSPSSETTLGYLRTINREAQKKLGLNHTAATILHANDAAHFTTMLEAGQWKALARQLMASAYDARRAGAAGLVVCGSALNPCATDIEEAIDLPVLSIYSAMAEVLTRFRTKRVGLLGPRTTREVDIWRRELGELRLMEPSSDDAGLLRAYAVRLVNAEAQPEEWQVEATRIISKLRRDGAQAIVLCAPELGRLARVGRTLLPVLDADEIHAWAAASWALGDG